VSVLAPSRPPAPALPPKPVDRYKWVFTAGVVAVVLWSAVGLDARWSRLLEAPADIWNLGRVMFTQMEAAKIPDLVEAMWESVSIAWMGTLIAAVFAIPLSFLAAENLVSRPIAWITRQVLNLLRAIPEVILALVFIPVFGLTPMAGVLAIGVGSIGTLGKLFYEIIEGIRNEPLEASDAVGATSLQRLRWGVLPQVTPELASLVLYRFEVNIRASAVLGVVGAGGIGGDLQQALLFKDFGTAGLGLIIIVIGTITVDTVSGAVRRRIVAGRASPVEDDLTPGARTLLLEPGR
jgi:phosphonate transport system permease protein